MAKKKEGIDYNDVEEKEINNSANESTEILTSSIFKTLFLSEPKYLGVKRDPSKKVKTQQNIEINEEKAESTPLFQNTGETFSKDAESNIYKTVSLLEPKHHEIEQESSDMIKQQQNMEIDTEKTKVIQLQIARR